MIDVRTPSVNGKRTSEPPEDSSTEVVVNQTGQNHAWYLIDPRSSEYFGYWDATTALALLFVALVTPYEVALLPTAKTFHDTLFIINRCVDRCLPTVTSTHQRSLLPSSR